MIISLFILLLVLAAAVRLTFFGFRILGRLIGFFFSAFGFILIGVLALSLIGLAVFVGPLVAIVGICTIIAALRRA